MSTSVNTCYRSSNCSSVLSGFHDLGFCLTTSQKGASGHRPKTETTSPSTFSLGCLSWCVSNRYVELTNTILLTPAWLSASPLPYPYSRGNSHCPHSGTDKTDFDPRLSSFSFFLSLLQKKRWGKLKLSFQQLLPVKWLIKEWIPAFSCRLLNLVLQCPGNQTALRFGNTLALPRWVEKPPPTN